MNENMKIEVKYHEKPREVISEKYTEYGYIIIEIGEFTGFFPILSIDAPIALLVSSAIDRSCLIMYDRAGEIYRNVT